MGPTAMDQNDRGRYILVVDSKTNDVFYTSMLLQRFDYRTCSASTATHALEMISMALPALVIVDLSLPGMSGIDLLDLLKQDARTADLPFIMLIQEGDLNAERRCRDAGAAFIVEKPVKAEELYRTVQAAIEPVPRANIRIQTKLPVRVNGVSIDMNGECSAVLSEHGMYVCMEKPYARNELVAIEMFLNERIISITAQVLYSHRFGEGPFKEPGMGLKFVRIAALDREFIRQFINDEVNRGIALPAKSDLRMVS
jgi:CheY-like chemotaxis protein